MAIMKTLTVGTETYTVRDPEAVSFEQPQGLTAVQQQIARENVGAVSVKEVADKLCPGFAESGAVVTCQPVEGYPLDITAEEGATVTRCGKNLIDPTEYMKQSSATTLDRDVFTTEFTSGGSFVNAWANAYAHPAGTYTVSVIPVTAEVSLSLFVYDHATGEQIARLMNVGINGYKLKFTATAPFRITVCGPNPVTGGVYGTYSYKLQLEVGSTANAYEPYKGGAFASGEPIPAIPGVNTIYADKGNVTVTGKADPVAIINKLTDAILSLGGNV